MRKLFVSLGTATALLLSSTAVRADPIINFGYSASAAVNPNVMPGDDPSVLYNTNNVLKTSSIKFTPANGAASYNTSDGVPSQVIIYNMTTASTQTAPAYDSFQDVAFNLAVTVTDGVSNVPKTFNFAGKLNADHVSSSSMHTDPSSQGISWDSPMSVTKTIGGNDYTMTVIHVTTSGAPNQNSPGAIKVEITATPSAGGSGTPPPGAPEPTSLVLAGLALPALLLARRRLKKAEAA